MSLKRSGSDSSVYERKNEKTHLIRRRANSKDERCDIHQKCILALKEAQSWKKKYYALVREKRDQMSSLQSSLMLLEARLKAEQRDIEERLLKQENVIEEQKRKIDTLKTANHKLIRGIVTLSENKSTATKPSKKHNQFKNEETQKDFRKTIFVRQKTANLKQEMTPSTVSRRSRSFNRQQELPFRENTRSNSLPKNLLHKTESL